MLPEDISGGFGEKMVGGCQWEALERGVGLGSWGSDDVSREDPSMSRD